MIQVARKQVPRLPTDDCHKSVAVVRKFAKESLLLLRTDVVAVVEMVKFARLSSWVRF